MTSPRYSLPAFGLWPRSAPETAAHLAPAPVLPTPDPEILEADPPETAVRARTLLRLRGILDAQWNEAAVRDEVNRFEREPLPGLTVNRRWERAEESEMPGPWKFRNAERERQARYRWHVKGEAA